MIVMALKDSVYPGSDSSSYSLSQLHGFFCEFRGFGLIGLQPARACAPEGVLEMG